MGKRDGYRTIVAFQSGDRAFFLYGFGKNERANVPDDEAEGYDRLGRMLLEFSDDELESQKVERKLKELMR